ncbi:hypothetical protein EXS65_03625 [Candidatus Peribacteria bacterium]|nr:hypothetical protein [Candidatus Peribacteria bacterium]
MSILQRIVGSIYSFLRILLFGAACIVAIIILIPAGMMLMGYKVNVDSKELAEESAKKGDPTLCANIINYGLLGPSTGESRSHCVYTYAKIAKDPTACSLIMPSDYGLSCINQSIESLFEDNQDAQYIDIDVNCSTYSSNPIRKDYCFFSQAHRSKDLNTCKQIKNPTIQSACNEKIGAWYKYPELRRSSYFGKYREP